MEGVRRPHHCSLDIASVPEVLLSPPHSHVHLHPLLSVVSMCAVLDVRRVLLLMLLMGVCLSVGLCVSVTLSLWSLLSVFL